MHSCISLLLLAVPVRQIMSDERLLQQARVHECGAGSTCLRTTILLVLPILYIGYTTVTMLRGEVIEQ